MNCYLSGYGCFCGSARKNDESEPIGSLEMPAYNKADEIIHHKHYTLKYNQERVPGRIVRKYTLSIFPD